MWLVRKPGRPTASFVLKIPKAEALANATDRVSGGESLASFVEEAKALAGLYHPNVAEHHRSRRLGRRAVLGARVSHRRRLEGEYATAHPMSLFELRQVVLDSCAGLAALHSAGLVHRDIKPANLWLRLPLAGGRALRRHKHRNPAVAPPLSTVVIDFGMVRAVRVPADVGGRFVAGDGRVHRAGAGARPRGARSAIRTSYALAGTVYNVTTGRAFFDEIENQRDRIIAHMRRDPFEDVERLKVYPAAMARLLRAATNARAERQPSPLEFGRELRGGLVVASNRGAFGLSRGCRFMNGVRLPVASDR